MTMLRQLIIPPGGTTTFGTTVQGVALSAGTQTVSSGTVAFADSNGVTFGMSGSSQITATVRTDYQSAGAYLTTAALSNHSHGDPTLALTNLTGTTASASNGFTLSLSAAAPGAGGGNIIAADTRTAGEGSSVVFSAANGVTFGLNAVGGSVMTATVKTDYLTSQSNQAASAANGSYAFQTLSFSNANGISFGTSAGSAITGSHNAITTARASNDAVGLNTAQTNVTWTVNSAGLSFNAGGYAGTGTSATNASITLNTNGLAISVAAPGGGAGVNRSFTEICAMERTALVFNVSATQFTKRPIFQPFWLDGSNLSVNTVRLLISRAAGTSLNCTIGVAFYSMANSTSLALVSSTTNAYSITTSALWSGIRFLDITGLSDFTLSEGRWVPAFYFSASNNSSAVMQFSVFGADPAPNFVGFLSAGTNATSATHASSGGFMPFWGVYSNTTAAFPANVGKSDMSMSGSAAMPEMWAGIFEVS